MPRPALVLASTSPYRRELLGRLKMPFAVDSPGIDESPHPGETARALVERLARQKALAVAQAHPNALIIGSDQVAVLDGEPLSKPGTHDRAVAQLRGMRGRRIDFLTGLAVHSTATGITHSRVIPYAVEFRHFSDAEMEAYLAAERPYDCAGAAKAEGLGIVLIHRMQGDDPNALIGLPLIALVDLLAMHGVSPLG